MTWDREDRDLQRRAHERGCDRLGDRRRGDDRRGRRALPHSRGLRYVGVPGERGASAPGEFRVVKGTSTAAFLNNTGDDVYLITDRTVTPNVVRPRHLSERRVTGRHDVGRDPERLGELRVAHADALRDRTAARATSFRRRASSIWSRRPAAIPARSGSPGPRPATTARAARRARISSRSRTRRSPPATFDAAADIESLDQRAVAECRRALPRRCSCSGSIPHSPGSSP